MAAPAAPPRPAPTTAPFFPPTSLPIAAPAPPPTAPPTIAPVRPLPRVVAAAPTAPPAAPPTTVPVLPPSLLPTAAPAAPPTAPPTAVLAALSAAHAAGESATAATNNAIFVLLFMKGPPCRAEYPSSFRDAVNGVTPLDRSLQDSPYACVRLAAALALMTIGGAGMYSMAVALSYVQAEFGVDRGAATLPYTLTMIGFG